MDILNEEMVIEVYINGNKVLSMKDGTLQETTENMEAIDNGTKL